MVQRYAVSSLSGRRLKLFVSVGSMLVAIAVLAGCLRPAAIWIGRGATVRTLVFMITRERESLAPVADLREFVIRTCHDTTGAKERTIWRVTRLRNQGRPPVTLRYGVVPENFSATADPGPLNPGSCYEAGADGDGISATLRFRIRQDGTVLEILWRDGHWVEVPV